MKIYNYDSTTFQYKDIGEADLSPLEEGVYLIPAYATEKEPLASKDGFLVKFIGNEWVYEQIPAPIPEPVKPEPELTYQQKRIAEYPPLMDYIDGVVKGDQAQIQAYIDACQAVKLKYPKV